LDAEKLQKAYAAGADDPSIAADQDQAADLEANGTPHFFINGQRVAGTRPIEEFRALVDKELARVTALLASASPKPNLSQGVYAALQASAAKGPGLLRVEAPALDAGTPRLGPPGAPITVQIFSDFECSFCRRVMFTMRELRDRYPGQIQFAWRQLPLSFHRHAGQAAATSVAVHEQMGDAAFWGLVDRMFGLGDAGLSELPAASALEEPEVLSLETLTRYAAEVGADTARVTAAVKAGSHTQRVESDQRLAAKLGISGTPAILINGYLVTGAQPLRRFDRLVRLSLQQ
jgi:protein-disulfide isomerase